MSFDFINKLYIGWEEGFKESVERNTVQGVCVQKRKDSSYERKGEEREFVGRDMGVSTE